MSVVLVLGHSFVRRMRDWLHRERDLHLGLIQAEIHYHGVGGYTLFHLWDELSLIHSLTPQVLVLDIGSNDLSYLSMSPHTFVQELHQFVLYVMQHTAVRQVAIMQVFYRNVGYVPRTHQRSLYEYNVIVREVNVLLANMCKNSQSIHLGTIRGMWRDYPNYIKPDGVHFNEQGMWKHRWNYRRVIITSVAHIQPPVHQ